MQYTQTSLGQDCTYIGVRVYVKDGQIRTTLYDREEKYPMHIPWYPAAGTVLRCGGTPNRNPKLHLCVSVGFYI